MLNAEVKAFQFIVHHSAFILSRNVRFNGKLNAGHATFHQKIMGTIAQAELYRLISKAHERRTRPGPRHPVASYNKGVSRG